MDLTLEERLGKSDLADSFRTRALLIVLRRRFSLVLVDTKLVEAQQLQQNTSRQNGNRTISADQDHFPGSRAIP